MKYNILRTFKIFFLFCLLYINGFPQTFAPIGAKWYYGHRENPMGSPAEGYLLFEVTGDTIIDTISCKIITKTIVNSDSSINNVGKIYLYKSFNRIYYFNNGEFDLLYDFNLIAGDTLKVKEPYYSGNNSDTLIKFIVDSIYNESISGIPHKLIYLHDINNYWDLFNPIIEDIGSLQYFFPQNNFDCDIANCFIFRCYMDSLINYHVSGQPCDNIVSNIPKIKLKYSNILIYPNPANENLIISVNNLQITINNVSIIDITGQIMLQTPFHFVIPNDSEESQTLHTAESSPGQAIQRNKLIVNIKTLPAGVYFVKVKTNTGEIIRKFVKQ